ncbi:MAG: adenylate/guanylate cyclase domain-containing protein [Burkholderiales bacterium]
MAEESGRTLVCSVLFIDIVEYSKKSVEEQFELKQAFNGMLGEALDVLQRRDRVIVDTGDGAAVVFLGDPEDALVVGLAVRELSGRVRLRMGINLGPVKLISDLNDQVNVVGDGINVAQRVMSFAEPGQLLVSSNYQDVVSRLSEQYATLFTREGRRRDKHVREHDVYSVSGALRITPRPLLDDPAPAGAGGYQATPHEPAKVLDAGSNLMISGASRASVAAALERLLKDGATVISPATLVGNRWIASCTRGVSGEVKVEEFGLTRVITGADPHAVRDKAAELVAFGAKLVRPPELVDGVWTAVCDTRR